MRAALEALEKDPLASPATPGDRPPEGQVEITLVRRAPGWLIGLRAWEPRPPWVIVAVIFAVAVLIALAGLLYVLTFNN
jgi:hypothetical protein